MKVEFKKVRVSTSRFTDAKGYYSFKELTLTHAVMRCRAVNYADQEKAQAINKDKENKIDFSLVPAPVPVMI